MPVTIVMMSLQLRTKWGVKSEVWMWQVRWCFYNLEQTEEAWGVNYV